MAKNIFGDLGKNISRSANIVGDNAEKLIDAGTKVVDNVVSETGKTVGNVINENRWNRQPY